MIVKKRRNRKYCIHFDELTKFEITYSTNTKRCYAKLSTWNCVGVNCSWYKEK